MKEIDRCREAFEKAGHDRMDFWAVWKRAWAARARSEAKKNRSVHAYLRLEKEAHRQTIQEAWEACGGHPEIKAKKQELLTVLKLMDEADDEHDVLRLAAEVVVREALESVSVHSCDVHNDEIKSRGLSESMKALYEALALK